ncbi:14287_t:CDS:2, partial [Ambispora leptoticha]
MASTECTTTRCNNNNNNHLELTFPEDFWIDKEASRCCNSITVNEKDDALVISVTLPDFDVQYEVIGGIVAIFGRKKETHQNDDKTVDKLSALFQQPKGNVILSDVSVTEFAAQVVTASFIDDDNDDKYISDFDQSKETLPLKVTTMTSIERDIITKNYQTFCHPIKLPNELVGVPPRLECDGVNGMLNIVMPKRTADVNANITVDADTNADVHTDTNVDADTASREVNVSEQAHRKAGELCKWME